MRGGGDLDARVEANIMMVMKVRSRHRSRLAARLLAAGMLVLPAGVLAGEPDFSIGGHASPESYPGMERVWSEEFSGAGLDTRHWSHETGKGNDGRSRPHYREENTGVRDGFLVITARKENFGGSQYTTSRITTRGKQALRFGRIDIRAKLPRGQGLHPVLSLPSAPRDHAGRIDIMEMIGGQGRENTVHGSLNWSNARQRHFESGSLTLPQGDFSDQFHVFSVVRDESTIRWLVDGMAFLELDIQAAEFDAFRQEFHLQVELGVGGERGGEPDASTLFPQHLVVDYIRVFR